MGGAGRLEARVAFDAPVVAPNGHGGDVTSWAQAHECRAGISFLRGGEAVIGARLSGRQPVVVRIRDCASARAVTPEWRMRDLRTGAIYNIRSAIPAGAYIDLTCESGVATGN